MKSTRIKHILTDIKKPQQTYFIKGLVHYDLFYTRRGVNGKIEKSIPKSETILISKTLFARSENGAKLKYKELVYNEIQAKEIDTNGDKFNRTVTNIDYYQALNPDVKQIQKLENMNMKAIKKLNYHFIPENQEH